MKGHMKVLLWVIIISMNILMDLNGIFVWIRCTPAAKTWNPYIPGTCWDINVYPTYGMFAAGRCSRHSISCLMKRVPAKLTLAQAFPL